jgi:cyclophilin family peptidyl-prolyl cis-trans isomerase
MRFLVITFLVVISCANSFHVQAQQTTANRLVLIETRFGDMLIMLSDSTPKHRDNFLKLASTGFYDSTIFHRVISRFMIQGGDPESKKATPGQRLGNGGPGYTIPAEFNPALYHRKGALAAARLGDNVNPQKNSSGCQFYIVQGQSFPDYQLDMFENRAGKKMTAQQREEYKTMGGTPHLDGGYTVFGELIWGFEVLGQIAAVAKDGGDRPVEDVRMKMRVIR